MVISINELSSIPIYMQIRDQIIMGISDGRLREGEQLPTVRALSLRIGVNTMTVSKAYQLLKQEGYIVTDRRNGAKVGSARENAGLSSENKHLLKRIASEARAGGMSIGQFMNECQNAYNGDT